MAQRAAATKRAYGNTVVERPWRLYAIFALLLAYSAIVVGKLAYIQLFQHDRFLALAQEEHWRQSDLPAPRGTILASDGAPLSISVDYETLYVDGKRLTDRARAVSLLAPVLGESEAAINAKIAAAGDSPAMLRRYVPAELADRVRALRLFNVYFEPEPRRLHPEASLASQLIGFVGLDRKGLLGLEMSWQDALAGKTGRLLAEVDTAGSEIALSARDYEAPVRGGDVVTAVDRFAQRLVERELDAAMKKHSADAGSIVVLEPSTGAVLAMASRPSFAVDDPDLFEPGKENLYNFPAVSGLYEPGSVFKVVTMSAGIDAGAVTPDERFYDNGYVTEGGVTIRNWDGQGHGWQTMAEILQRSLNTGSSYVAKEMGPAKFYDYVRAFGFGKPTGVDLPGEADGIVRDQRSAGWSTTDLLTNSFGQGISVTPLQMARAVAVVANQGRLMTPQVVREVRSSAGTQRIVPETARQVIKPETARILTDMMINAVDKSVVGLAKVSGYKVAGKSGTAETLVNGRYSQEDTIASFVGFAPADAPRYLVLVAIVRPKDNIWGESVAAPIFATVMQELLAHGGIAPQVAVTR
ncbi:MAG: peptidoglycan D,D-transpeptidase FtsI family protein [Chloroflexota bacterium]